MAKKKQTTRKRQFNRQKIEQQLKALERRLADDVSNRLANVQNASAGKSTELLDMAAEGELDYMSAISAEAGSEAIDEVRRALEKLREGTYGACEGCQKPIKKRRLKARPFAVLCIECKEQQERLGYVPGPDMISTRADAGVGVSLTDDDAHTAETSADDVFRSMEDLEISEIY